MREENILSDKKLLLGKTVQKISLCTFDDSQSYKQPQQCIRFDTDNGTILWETDADCCSETWFADLIGYAHLRGQTVTRVVEVDLPHEDGGRTRQEHDMIFGIDLYTSAGVCSLIFRNSSNGYYGGSVHERIWQEDRNPVVWKEITEDFSA